MHGPPPPTFQTFLGHDDGAHHTHQVLAFRTAMEPAVVGVLARRVKGQLPGMRELDALGKLDRLLLRRTALGSRRYHAPVWITSNALSAPL